MSVARVATAAALFGAAVFVGGCCQSCTGKLMPEKVPAAEAEKQAKSFLEKARDIASTMCGLPAEGLRVTKATHSDSAILPGTAYVQVEGTPVLAPDAGKIDPAKLVACSGTVVLSVQAVKKEDGTIASWRVSSAWLHEVTTPGVKWERPRGKGL